MYHLLPLLDVAEIALENGRRRYEEMHDRAGKDKRWQFQAHFIVADATTVRNSCRKLTSFIVVV